MFLSYFQTINFCKSAKLLFCLDPEINAITLRTAGFFPEKVSTLSNDFFSRRSATAAIGSRRNGTKLGNIELGCILVRIAARCWSSGGLLPKSSTCHLDSFSSRGNERVLGVYQKKKLSSSPSYF